MKFIFFTLFALFLAGATQIKAQSILDRVDRTLNKADRATNTADRSARTGDNINRVLGGKKNSKKSGNHTAINIKGITLSSLKTINQNIQKVKGVSSTKMKYSSGASSIVVFHSGTTDDLLPSIQKISPIFADKNILGLEDGSISVQVKK